MKLTILALALAALASPLAAATQQAPQDFAGAYTLSGVSEGDEVCKLTLGREGTVGGWTIKLHPDCYRKFGLSKDIAAWTTGADGSIRFIDPLRQPLIKFEPVPVGGYIADRPGQEPISLDRETHDKPPTEQQRMAGDWILTRMGGETVCRYSLSSNAIATVGIVKAKPGCPAAWAKAVKWSRPKGAIVLLDKAGKPVLRLKGDSIEGFDGDGPKGELYGFQRDW